MNNQFGTYLQLGFEHISDLGGYDHILFIVALCAVYRLKEWRRVAILATAFTVGHSITLILAALDVFSFPSRWVEFLIPVTIVLTALYNVLLTGRWAEDDVLALRRSVRLNYVFALVFGLVHGMGFSSFFRASLFPGEESSLVRQLLAFNLGVELGQLMIVGIVLLLSYVVIEVGRARQREWNLFVSGAAAGVAFILAAERWPW